MKILDGIARFGEACNKMTLSHSHDITEKLHFTNKEKPTLMVHTEGDFSIKILKLAASTAIVVGAYAVADILTSGKSSKKGDK